MKRFCILATAAILILNFNCKKEDETVHLKGLINFKAGKVILTDMEGKIRDAAIGDEIIQGMKIETIGEKSFVDIYIGDYIIKVIGDTVVEIDKLFENAVSGNRQVNLKMEKGTLFSRIKRKLARGDVYEIRTPTATAGVRGTDFLVTEEDGKANVACLEGLVAVLNNSLEGGEPVFLEKQEETDVIPGQNMVKRQLTADRLRILNIKTEIKALQKEIRQKFEKQREEIRQQVKDLKVKNKEMLEAQKEKDKAMVSEQKQSNSEMMEAAKDRADEAAGEAVSKAKEQMESVKVDKESVKPAIDKDQFKVNKDQFKIKKKEDK